MPAKQCCVEPFSIGTLRLWVKRNGLLLGLIAGGANRRRSGKYDRQVHAMLCGRYRRLHFTGVGVLICDAPALPPILPVRFRSALLNATGRIRWHPISVPRAIIAMDFISFHPTEDLLGSRNISCDQSWQAVAIDGRGRFIEALFGPRSTVFHWRALSVEALMSRFLRPAPSACLRPLHDD
jgi:hypothetical protein